MSTRQETPSESLAGETRGRTTESSLQDRLLRYEGLKVKSGEIADFLTLQPDLPSFPGLAGRIQTCGDLLQFRNYYEIDEIRLHRANFCETHMLCPFCAMRRGAKFARSYAESIEHIKSLFPGIILYHVVLTIKNGPSLKERFQHIESSVTKMLNTRREAKKGRRSPIEFNKALGGVFSFEIKRGEDSDEWHPHIHALVLSYEEISMKRLSQEWLAVTGDSVNVFVEECHGDIATAGLEVFAYALKFSKMENGDLWEAYKTLRGKRFVRSFGVLRGVEIPESLLDDPIKDQPYYDMLYSFIHGKGYQLRSMDIKMEIKQETEIL